MPKLNDEDRQIRIDGRVAELEAGKEVASRDIRILLSSNLQVELDAEWAHQQALRKQKRARTPEEQEALGWKSKRQVQIEILKKASDEIEGRLLETVENRLAALELKRSKAFLEAFTAVNAGKNPYLEANNALVRSGMQPYNRKVVTWLSSRDKEVQAIEDRLREMMTRDEHGELDNFTNKRPKKAK
jgi:hypothetical protein